MVNTAGLRYIIENTESLPYNVKADIYDVIAFYEEANAKPARTRNSSGVVQVDAETGEEIARFKTKKEANIALGKPESASGISDATNGRSTTHFAYGYKWFHVDEWDAMNQ